MYILRERMQLQNRNCKQQRPEIKYLYIKWKAEKRENIRRKIQKEEKKGSKRLSLVIINEWSVVVLFLHHVDGSGVVIVIVREGVVVVVVVFFSVSHSLTLC